MATGTCRSTKCCRHHQWSRGAEDGEERFEKLRTGDDAGSVTLSGLHLSFIGVHKPTSNLGHVYGQTIRLRKFVKPLSEFTGDCHGTLFELLEFTERVNKSQIIIVPLFLCICMHHFFILKIKIKDHDSLYLKPAKRNYREGEVGSS